MEEKSTRRVFLTTIGAAGAVSLAGCTSFGGGSDDAPASPGSETTGNGDNSNGTDGNSNGTGTDSDNKNKEVSGKSLSTFSVEEFKNEEWKTIEGSVKAGIGDAVHGGQSVELSPKNNANEKMAVVRHEYRNRNRLDLSKQDLALAAKVKNPTDQRIKVRAVIRTAGENLTSKRQFPANFNGWARFDLGYEDVVDGTALDKVVGIDIQFNRGGKDFTVLVDDLRLIPKANKGKVMIQLDDAHISQYENAFEILKDSGVPASVGVIPNSLRNDDRISFDQLKEMANNGIEVNTHGKWRAAEVNKQVEKENMKQAKNYVKELGFKEGAEHFIYPYGQMDSHTLKNAKDVFSSAYVQGGMPNNAKNPVNPQFISRIDGTAISGSRDIINAAEAYNQLAVIYFHEVGDYDSGSAISANQFKEQIDFIKSKDMDVIVPSDLF
ncbi:polysaccharide deacetylase family protein [Halocatena halophila]|uniref:polysaccharide deacetylase family protein n=1 Tax=Halocatena halophila TaxID=2814576 RepID=UPI002ED08D71